MDVELVYDEQGRPKIDYGCYMAVTENGLSIRIGSTKPPVPNTIPDHLLDAYSLHGRIPIQYAYDGDSRSSGKGMRITKETYDAVFAALENRTFKYYGDSINCFYDAVEKYPFEDKTVLIWGLEACNCEAFAVWKKARKVYVVDYNAPLCEHEKITVLTHEQLKGSGLKTDIAISFSSFEHDGLGRYGDPLNPVGDLVAMQQAHEHLKPEGLLFFGVPMGQDCVMWNLHRIYGAIRTPMLLKNWLCLDAFDYNPQYTPDFPFDAPLGATAQPLLILKAVQGGLRREMLVDNIKRLSKMIRQEGAAGTHTPRIAVAITQFMLPTVTE